MGRAVETLSKIGRFRSRLIWWVAVLIVPLALLVLGLKALDRQLFYTPVTAVVTGVGEECELYNRRVRAMPRMACAEARSLAGTSRYRSYDLRRHEIVRYRYRSPADEQMHDGQADLPAGAARPVAGSSIEVRAHRWRASASQL